MAWLKDRSLQARSVILATILVLIVFPIAAIKRVDSLRFTSTLGLLLQFGICAYIIVIGGQNLVSTGSVAITARLSKKPSLDMLRGFALIAFGFCNQVC